MWPLPTDKEPEWTVISSIDIWKQTIYILERRAASEILIGRLLLRTIVIGQHWLPARKSSKYERRILDAIRARRRQLMPLAPKRRHFAK